MNAPRKILIPATIVEINEGTFLAKLETGLGDPEIRVMASDFKNEGPGTMTVAEAVVSKRLMP